MRLMHTRIIRTTKERGLVGLGIFAEQIPYYLHSLERWYPVSLQLKWLAITLAREPRLILDIICKTTHEIVAENKRD